MSILAQPQTCARILLRALSKGGVMAIEAGGHRTLLACAERDAIVEDPESDTAFKALQSGIFRRFPVSGGSEEWRWMRVCSASETDVEMFLAHLVPGADSPQALEEVCVQCAARSVLMGEDVSAPRPF